MWKRVKPLKDESKLESFEKQYNIILPIELRKLIVENNGGRPMPNILNIDNKEYAVGWLLSYNEEDVNTVFKVSEYFMSNYDRKLLPFATEESGDYYCMDLSNQEVLYWKHDNEEYKKICNSLSEFLGYLE